MREDDVRLVKFWRQGADAEYTGMLFLRTEEKSSLVLDEIHPFSDRSISYKFLGKTYSGEACTLYSCRPEGEPDNSGRTIFYIENVVIGDLPPNSECKLKKMEFIFYGVDPWFSNRRRYLRPGETERVAEYNDAPDKDILLTLKRVGLPHSVDGNNCWLQVEISSDYSLRGIDHFIQIREDLNAFLNYAMQGIVKTNEISFCTSNTGGEVRIYSHHRIFNSHGAFNSRLGDPIRLTGLGHGKTFEGFRDELPAILSRWSWLYGTCKWEFNQLFESRLLRERSPNNWFMAACILLEAIYPKLIQTAKDRPNVKECIDELNRIFGVSIKPELSSLVKAVRNKLSHGGQLRNDKEEGMANEFLSASDGVSILAEDLERLLFCYISAGLGVDPKKGDVTRDGPAFTFTADNTRNLRQVYPENR